MKIFFSFMLLLSFIVVTPAMAQDNMGDEAMWPTGVGSSGAAPSGYTEGSFSGTWSFITGMPQNLPSGITIDNVQTTIADALNKIITNLDSALTQIDADANLSDEQKSQLKAKAQEAIKQITKLKESVDNAKSLSELLSVASAYASSNQNLGVPVSTNVSGIQSMVNNLNLQGIDVSSLQKQLNQVNGYLPKLESGSTMNKDEIVKQLQLLKNEIVNFKLKNPKLIPSKGPKPSGATWPTISISGQKISITPPENMCAQVITSANNPTTGECKNFPTSCIPQGWIKVPSCTQ